MKAFRHCAHCGAAIPLCRLRSLCDACADRVVAQRAPAAQARGVSDRARGRYPTPVCKDARQPPADYLSPEERENKKKKRKKRRKRYGYRC